MFKHYLNCVFNKIWYSDEKEEMLDGAESQNYGYGYGTKVGDDNIYTLMVKEW